MTSNASPPPTGQSGRRRALGRGPGVPPAEPVADPAAEPTRPVPPETAPVASPVESVAPAESAEAAVPDERGEPGERVEWDEPDERVELVEPDEPAGLVEPVEPIASVEPAVPVESVAVVGASVSPVAAVAGSAAVGAGAVGPAAEPRHAVKAPTGDGDGDGEGAADDGVFKVRLANFEGPFDLLLQLISRHKLDVTEVALSKVTDEFMAYIRAMGPDWDLDETTEFLVVAATLLDLKAARLLPAAEVEDEADLALLEARDLLFARLLQYRAYKQIADIFNGRLDDEARRYPRTVGLEPQHAELLPEVVISIGAEGFAKLAVKAMQPRPKPQVYVDHIHAPLVSVQEQAGIVIARLRELGEASFRALVEDTDDTLTVVARFLALLELYREKAVALEQEAALGELLVRWTGGDGDETPTVTDEFDRPPEPPKEEKTE
ncbi:segregation/condensation protein A [Streptomyces viridochromogenes]|uniref:segregation/condensation protein A n=1 Tax=Streptomyces viridochromogenes TaxID=1938 RepID=UPI0007C5291E|nr:segregation/condensation protein A [Streptomyces viridochromogenes]